MNVSPLEELLAHRETVFRLCLGFARNYAEAEDLAQEVFLKAMAAVETLRDPGRSREWLLRIARNTCLDHGKQRRIRAMLLLRFAAEPVVENAAAGIPADDVLASILRKAVACLPKRLKDVFIMREYADLSYAEIGRSLGLKEGTVMSRLSRARDFVARKVKENAHAAESSIATSPRTSGVSGIRISKRAFAGG